MWVHPCVCVWWAGWVHLGLRDGQAVGWGWGWGGAGAQSRMCSWRGIGGGQGGGQGGGWEGASQSAHTRAGARNRA